jgi:hypothetical protein
MKRAWVLLLLVVVILAVITPAALAKPGKKMVLVCWMTPKGVEEHAYFLTTGSGIVHRFKLDGKHDIYKPGSADDRPATDHWAWWENKLKGYQPCSVALVSEFLPDDFYWHAFTPHPVPN